MPKSKSSSRRGASSRPPLTARVGVVENGNAVTLVTVATSGEVLDRREATLTHGLPTHPHHHEGSWAVGRYRQSPWAREVDLEEALALVEQVRLAANEGARRLLTDVQGAVTVPIAGVALRQCPELPASVEACIRDNRAQSYADSVMYRRALETAARERGWSVFWYDKETLFDVAARANGTPTITALLDDWGKTLGKPWQAKHKLAAAAALAATAA